MRNYGMGMAEPQGRRTLPSLLAALLACLLVVSACGPASDDAAAEGMASTTTVVESDSASAEEVEVEASVELTPAEAFNVRLARTVNLGGRFEPPRGASWINGLDPDDLDQVASKGFTAVRIPIRFSDWADVEAPYALDAGFVAEIEAFVDRAEQLDLAVIIDLHHYEEMATDPRGNRARLLGIWTQVIDTFGDRDPSSVAFELLNEPNQELDAELWNEIIEELVAQIRDQGSEHTLIFGPVSWNNLVALDDLEVPDDDNLIVTFHYYDPFEFTHQGADWLPHTMDDIGTRWSPNADGAADEIDADFAEAAAWAERNGVPLFLGEFGVLVTHSESVDRLAWTTTVRTTAEKYGISWAFWDLTGDKFGIYDEAAQTWQLDELLALGVGP